MMCDATLTTDSKDGKAVAKSLNADNVRMDSLTVKTTVAGGTIVSHIESQSVSCLLSTVDDLLRCQMTAESLI